MNVCIKTIDHKDQRQNQVGDWIIDRDGSLTILVSKFDDWRMEFLVACHEFVESILCMHSGVSQKKVDAFDGRYERNRQGGDVSEAGDAKGSPYAFQHGIASGVERILAAFLGVTWLEYEAKCDRLIEVK